ncbi:hypothetical protein ACFL1M_00875 [Patescibacteria group bacterium]
MNKEGGKQTIEEIVSEIAEINDVAALQFYLAMVDDSLITHGFEGIPLIRAITKRRDELLEKVPSLS